MAKKSTNAEIELRALEVYECIIRGYSYTDITRYCEEKWNVTSASTIHRLMNRAMERIKEKTSAEFDYLRDEANKRYLRLYSEAYKNSRWNDCIRILARLDRINGRESITLRHEGALNLMTVDIPISENEMKEVKNQLDSIFGKHGKKIKRD